MFGKKETGPKGMKENGALLLKVSKGPAAGYLDVGNLKGVAKIG